AAADFMIQVVMNYYMNESSRGDWSKSIASVDYTSVAKEGFKALLPWKTAQKATEIIDAARISIDNYNPETSTIESVVQDFAINVAINLSGEAADLLKKQGLDSKDLLALARNPGWEKRLRTFERFSPNWSKGSKSKALNDFADGVEGVVSPDGVKTRYYNTETGIEVIVDNENPYFRIYDHNRKDYLDKNGNIPRTGHLLGSKAKNYRQSQTHILNED
ncbi:MAG: hypothetical protein MRY83_04160, partial [Flavobacteriales bacterium]|nr:hypothetical protein [Flavobacteriales bacterium]